MGAAAERTVVSLREGAVEHEPAFTDRMLGRMEEAMRTYESKGLRWSAKTLTDTTQRSQESRHGADFAGVFEASLVQYSVKKGFLAQAKLLEPGASLSKRDLVRLRDQCDKMLGRSSESFVFVYSRKNIIVVPAVAVASMNGGRLHDLYQRRVTRFLEEHFSCFIGDRGISAPTPEVLESLAADLDVRSALYIQVTRRQPRA